MSDAATFSTPHDESRDDDNSDTEEDDAGHEVHRLHNGGSILPDGTLATEGAPPHVSVRQDDVGVAPPPPPRFDARGYIKRYRTASATWHASLASGLRTAYGRASDRKRSTAPRSSQATGPIRIRLAMRACHHWYKLEHAQWGSVTPLASRGVLLARLHHVYDASVAWGTLVPPPVVTPDWDTNDRAEWDAWASDAIPAIHRFMILSGVAHVQGTFCTHPMGNETRLPCGPSLGGALRPGGTNTIIDGLLLYDDTSTHERWNCSDADLRRHMANEIMRLSSDKTVPSTIYDGGVYDISIYEGSERRPF